jgi:hypothetical protein
MIPEIAQAILSPPLRIDATGGGAIVSVDLEANFCRHRQQDLAVLVALRMADERVFTSGAGCCPEHGIANSVSRLLRASIGALLFFRGQTSERRLSG